MYTRYGKCYTFNSGEKYPPLKTLKGGIDNGLELLLDTQQNDYMPVWDESGKLHNDTTHVIKDLMTFILDFFIRRNYRGSRV